MIERPEAESALASSSAEERLAGARFFSKHASPSDLPLLRGVHSKETVPWIKRALQRALDRATKISPDSTTSEAAELDINDAKFEDSHGAVLQGMHAQAVEEVAGTILHEFAPMIGMLKLLAIEEIENYSQSKSKQILDLLSDLLQGVRNLKRAAAVPKYSNFDLHESLCTARNGLADLADGVEIHFAGQVPFPVVADRETMTLALINGLRNALEAVHDNQSRKKEVTINWGRAGSETWLAMLDSGSGFAGDPSIALKLGHTNKAGHIGYGLATAQQTMRSMDGDVLLSNGPDGGAIFEIRWDGDNAAATS
ncbi:HAMP domain-containing sensor histidine kinase [Caballeronia sp. SBC2]|uniref:ATP-binding protein n=1 Tax=Caballeronia sp. SBC2 TaxID=2705547 RepID=UPI0013E16B9A|nr:HAMP domain-containing sensor histidine kinase [Caballeronia sp. SBC2]QIE30405.1 hypothetical protein SBC2_84820 [Caballeronia sp. SBC2]